MTGPDDRYRESQELSRALERALTELREDVASLVAQEVERRGHSKAEIETLVAELARREVRKQKRAADPLLYRWAPTLAAVATVLVLAGGVWAWERWDRGDAEAAPRTAAAGPAPAATAPPEPRAEARPTVAAREARYEALLREPAPELAPLIDRLEQATQNAAVRVAIAAWRDGATTEAQRERLHSALAQLIARDVRPSLGIDGLITRSPCGGSSCPALLEAWRGRAAELDYAVPAAPTEQQIRTAERLLVLRAVEDA